jgi:hypothetical protein
VAWATPAGDRANLSEIKVVQNWGAQMRNLEKIPSVVSFTKKSPERGERQFGADLSKDAIAMVHTKLQLGVGSTSDELDHILEALDGIRNLSFQYVKKSEGLPKQTLLGPEEIVKEYLERVFHYIFEAESESLSNFAAELRSRTPVDIVVTIPAVSVLLFSLQIMLNHARNGTTGLRTPLSELLQKQDSTMTKRIFLAYEKLCSSLSQKPLLFTRPVI